jgi:hypothetical protein
MASNYFISVLSRLQYMRDMVEAIKQRRSGGSSHQQGGERDPRRGRQSASRDRGSSRDRDRDRDRDRGSSRNRGNSRDRDTRGNGRDTYGSRDDSRGGGWGNRDR